MVTRTRLITLHVLYIACLVLNVHLPWNICNIKAGRHSSLWHRTNYNTHTDTARSVGPRWKRASNNYTGMCRYYSTVAIGRSPLLYCHYRRISPPPALKYHLSIVVLMPEYKTSVIIITLLLLLLLLLFCCCCCCCCWRRRCLSSKPLLADSSPVEPPMIPIAQTAVKR